MKSLKSMLPLLILLSLTSCRSSTPKSPVDSTGVIDEPLVVTEPAQSPTNGTSPSTQFNFDQISWDDRSIFTTNLITTEQSILSDLKGTTIYHIQLVIPEDMIHLSGHEEVLYTNMEKEPLEDIYFRLYPNIFSGEASLSAITIDGIEIEPQYELLNSAVRLTFPDPLQPQESASIAMDFMVEVPTVGSGNYGLFGYIDGVLVLHMFYPAIPVYDDEGWNVEIPPMHGDVNYFDTSFYLVQIVAPEDLIIAASGVEINKEVEGDQQRITLADGPARCFYLAASEQFLVMSETIGETKLNGFYLPDLEAGARSAIKIAIDSVKSYNDRLGVYPFTELDLASTPMQALGMEYSGITAISTRLFDLDGEISETPTSIYLESTVAHEIAHQWFYNMVGNDQVDEPWVDEAVVQYMTGLYYLDAYGTDGYDGFKDSWNGRWNRVDFADIPIGLPAADYDSTQYGAIVYGRGPLFIDALAEKMGQEIFDSFIKDYFESNKWGIGTAAGFRELAEKYCECDLTDLFEEWVY